MILHNWPNLPIYYTKVLKVWSKITTLPILNDLRIKNNRKKKIGKWYINCMRKWRIFEPRKERATGNCGIHCTLFRSLKFFFNRSLGFWKWKTKWRRNRDGRPTVVRMDEILKSDGDATPFSYLDTLSILKLTGVEAEGIRWRQTGNWWHFVRSFWTVGWTRRRQW